ncbi:MAG TPA: alpha/beta hydrolase [Acidimicrobiales bacterium]|nr:alpha/beta hydrolase [Acidimicrobiales bacterium]
MEDSIRAVNRVDTGAVELCYELDEGDGPVLVLVSGLGRSHVGWDPEFLDLLRAEGFRVLRFCNRDCGRSTILDDAPRFDLAAALRKDRSVVTYTLDDMADDTAALLRALGIDSAHLVGTSMGGMIAQMVAVRHPSTVRSLCSIMSTTGARHVGEPTPEAGALLTTKAPEDRDGFVAHELANQKVIGSRGALVDEQWRRRTFERVYDHGVHPRGTGRQLMAIVASGDRTAALASITAPTVVIHGVVDTLVQPSGGEATAAAIAGARLVTIADMGHEMPPGVWPEVVALVVANAREGDPALGGSKGRA